MKRTLAVAAILALGATSAFATNGSTMIGVGAKALGMGGAGIGVGHGAESALANPALITTIKGNNEVSFGGTVFMPDIENTNDNGVTSTTMTSDSDFFVIPSVSVANKVNDNFYWGVGMWGTGGLGVDYRDGALPLAGGAQFQMVTALSLMQFGVPLAYTTNGFTAAITPIVQYSSLDVNYMHVDNPMAPTANVNAGAGAAQDVALGMNYGLSYKTGGLTLGATYKSEIKFNIDDVITNAMAGFGIVNSVAGMDEMSTPSEYGLGTSYKMGEHTIALDWRHINWEDAEVYKDFGWEDQDAFAVGYEYATDKWALRAGYQYAESAVQDNTGKNLAIDVEAQGAGMMELTNTLNMLGFPGNQESHVTLGGSYSFNEKLSVDVAAVFGLENKTTLSNFAGQDITTKHSEQAYSVQLNYNF